MGWREREREKRERDSKSQSFQIAHFSVIIFQGVTNIAVFAGSLEVESEWIYIYHVMRGCSRVTLAHLKGPSEGPYSRNKQLVHLTGP